MICVCLEDGTKYNDRLMTWVKTDNLWEKEKGQK